MDERSFPEVAGYAEGFAQLKDRRAALRGLADELEALLEEQLSGLGEEEARAARIAAELEERAGC